MVILLAYLVACTQMIFEELTKIFVKFIEAPNEQVSSCVRVILGTHTKKMGSIEMNTLIRSIKK